VCKRLPAASLLSHMFSFHVVTRCLNKAKVELKVNLSLCTSGVQAGNGVTAPGIRNHGTKAKYRSAFHIFHFVRTERPPGGHVILGCDGPKTCLDAQKW
jgi:hypothetical protein